MGHHGQMHAQPGVGVRPDAPVAAGTHDDRREGPATSEGDPVPAPEPPDPDRPEWGYLPATAFRSRRSALSDAQRQTWERLWPELGRPQPDQPELRGPLDIHAWFGREAPVVLEIGSG